MNLHRWWRLAACGCVLVTAPVFNVATEPSPPRYLRMKVARILDARGFERPLTAVTLLIPSDWTAKGDVSYAANDLCTALPRLSFRATSQDGRVAVEGFPMATWSWSDDPRYVGLMEQVRQRDAQLGMKRCDIGPPLSAGDFLTRVFVPTLWPGARVLEVKVDPEAQRAAQEMARSRELQSRRTGVPIQFLADTARAHIAYEKDGRPEEAWVSGMTTARVSPAPFLDMATNRPIQIRNFSCGADFLFAASAPPDRLLANEKLFRVIVGSVRVDPAWFARIQQVQLNVAAGEVRSAERQSRIIARSAEETRQMLDEGWQRRGEAQDRAGDQWSQAMRGVDTFQNPTTGEMVDLSNRYGDAWSNARGEYLLSDSPGFDPNSVSRETWQRLQRVQAEPPR